jgi:uncharacterized protein (DUF2062 family)
MGVISIISKIKIRLKLLFEQKILPVVFTPSPPGELARGAFVGMFIGLTPTEGIQILLITLLWYMARYVKGIRFSFKAAFAASMISNYATVVPLYFLFYYTGAVAGRALWHWNSPVSYGEFVRLLEPLSTVIFPKSITMLLDISGSLLAPLFLGCIPFATAGSVIAYLFTSRILSYYGPERRDAASLRPGGGD